MPVLYPFALLALFLIFASMVRKSEVSAADPRQDMEIAQLRERVEALEKLLTDEDRILRGRFDKL
ncbi:MAG: hypothetical protein R3C13_03750 [Hyphomonas sp.]|uniref:hypothetical protein n=1 Tax=Hyphomonas sp. TaxID=87 RepID=UPI003528CF61